MKTGNKFVCENCNNKCTSDIYQLFPLIDLSGIKTKTKIKEYFCNKKCKGIFNNYRQSNTVPSLAELDESMNYCKYFVREKGNEGYYIRDGRKYLVDGLWDYKSTPDHFKKWFKDNFGNVEYFKLHERYL